MSLPELERFAQGKLAISKEHAMIVRGDKRVPYGKFVEIVDRLKKVGVTKLGIMGLSSKQ
jgi:biopolymer transport protein ExbD